ncbi:MAG: molybdopterin molybdotransferase MoeA, partial [bacterium]|nr:molybdopterin molybdotransferase MoeA [bacterium]
MLSVSEARHRINSAIQPLPAELVALDHSLGRVLAEDVSALRRLPPCDDSAMDGFAVRRKDVPGDLPIAGTIAAGDPPGTRLEPGTTLRIMTGAPLPTDAEAVIIRENVDDRGDTAHFSTGATLGQHIRRAGEDIGIGQVALSAGMRLGPGEIGLLAALGHAVVKAGRRPRVAVMSTGDELVGVDVTPKAGQIVNSNAYALAAQIREAGGIPVHAGIAPDAR